LPKCKSRAGLPRWVSLPLDPPYTPGPELTSATELPSRSSTQYSSVHRQPHTITPFEGVTMDLTTLDVVCPACSQNFTVPPEELATCHRPAGVEGPVEAECPTCGWEFSVDEDGEVLDDGGVEFDPLFAVNDEGELDAEDLIVVRCPFCACVHE